MKPGEGYMMLRKAESDATFTYPFFDLNSNFREDWSTGTKRAAAAKSRTTMSVSAVVEGFEVEDGDVLVAYADGEEVGVSMMYAGEPQTTHGLFYLSISDHKTSTGSLWFAIERGGEIVAATDEVMTYKANAVIGSPDEPTAINFVRTTDVAFESGKWYTIGGLQLQKKPTRKGLYIFNGKKVVVK
jgi:hypothetical protein